VLVEDGSELVGGWLSPAGFEEAVGDAAYGGDGDAFRDFGFEGPGFASFDGLRVDAEPCG
jgi:hypothetical protein